MIEMTEKERQAYEWAIKTPFHSVAADYAQTLAQFIERTMGRPENKSFYNATGLGMVVHQGQTYYLNESEYEALSDMGADVAAGTMTSDQAIESILSARGE